MKENGVSIASKDYPKGIFGVFQTTDSELLTKIYFTDNRKVNMMHIARTSKNWTPNSNHY
jgi:hypothetical protein